MPAPSESAQVTYRDWTLRVRPAASAPGRLLLLVHGWTGDENSMWVFARNLSADYYIVAPRAPHDAHDTGYSWTPVKHGERAYPKLGDLRPAVDRLMEVVSSYAADRSLDAAQFDAMGFSQGAVLVSAMALLYPERMGRIGVLAGFVPDGAEALISSRPLSGKRVFVAHGTQDKLVPIEYGRRSVRLLQEAGADVTYCEDEVGHKLSADCLRALEMFFG